MKVETKDYGLLVTDATEFDPESTLTCGQVFRFGKKQDTWWVIAGDNYAEILPNGEKSYKIYTTNSNFFLKYFDFEKDYAKIISELGEFKVLEKPIEYGRGIRLLHQNVAEMIISFIISACNRIPRIQKSLNKISERFGEKHEWGYAFPTLKALSVATEDDFMSFGCGYRSGYLVQTIAVLNDTDFLARLTQADTLLAKAMLKSLMGVGDKVADCILLFALARYDVFPVDTWIYKVYRDEFCGTEKNRAKISKFLVEKFGSNSGYAQQYLFYYKRQNENRKGDNYGDSIIN